MKPAFVCLLFMYSLTCGKVQPRKSPQSDEGGAVEELEHEYMALYETTEDKAALEAVRDLHKQLDGDNDGTIEPSETGEFMKGDLYQGNGNRGHHFHDKDAEITVADLWITWKHSEVFNWTVDRVAEWVSSSVELPQYKPYFVRAGVNGTQMPKIAASPQYLSKVIGISSPIHRSKLTLKAMDLVLFGPPKDNNFWKDTILTSLLVLAVTGLMYAYRQNKMSKEQLQRMMADMDSLAKAEETLKDLQDTLQQKDSKIESLSSMPSDLPDAVEISRLREELDILRSELQRAEVELEDKCWMAPPVLQHWLQLTYELESIAYNAKKKAAEEQLEMAKDMCDKLKRKRSSLVGAFVSTHGRSIDDVDKSILDAKTSLMELTKDLTERSQRWRQIEMLCGCSIIKNPGVAVLQNLVRHVGISRGAAVASSASTNRLSTSASHEDFLDEMDSRSVAGHSVANYSVVSSSHHSKASAGNHSVQLRGLQPASRSGGTALSKDSSSSSEEATALPSQAGRALHRPASIASAHSQPSSPLQQQEQYPTFTIDNQRLEAPKAAAPTESDGQVLRRGASSEGSGLATLAAAAAAKREHFQVASKPSVVEEEEEDEDGAAAAASCSASESGSLAELGGAGRGAEEERATERKKRSFFHFRKKKEKKVAA